MFLIKRSNGYYYVSFCDSQGKLCRVSTNTKCKPDANKFLREFQVDSLNRPERLLLSKFIPQYLEYSRIHHAPNTTAKAGYALKFFIACLGDRFIDTIGSMDIERFKSWRLQKVGPVTTNIDLRTIKSAFGTAVRWEIIAKTPFKNVRLLTIPQHRPLFFSKPEFASLLEAIQKPWLQRVVVFTANTGLRRGEVASLKWNQVDLDRRVIYIGNTDTFHTKTGRERAVPLNLVAQSILQSLPRTDEYVFLAELGGPLNGERLSHLFKEAVRDAKLNDQLHFHHLRHTFATWLVQCGVGIYEVQKLLGHTTVTVTQIYSHLSGYDLHSSVDRITINMN